MPDTTNTALLDAIPSLNLAHFTDGTAGERAKFVQDLGEAFQNIGFVALSGHGLSDELQTKLYAAVRTFFALSDAEKENCYDEAIAGQRGYTKKGQEKAKGATTPDLKEFYQIGQELEVGDQDKGTPDYPDNLWPADLPEFKLNAIEAYRTLEKAGKEMLKAIAIYLQLPEDYFAPRVHNGNSIVRCIHYFPLDPDKVAPDAVRAGAHGDINLITLLIGASADGLQVLRRDGQWIGITALPNQLVVNVGDMLDRLTNHKLKSTIHQVVNPPRELMNTPRYSIPFFMHPRADMDLSCLPSCVDAEHPRLYNNITAGAFLDERLREIGLKK